MAYGDFEDLTRRTDSNKILPNKAVNIAKNSEYGKYQRGLAQWFIIFLVKRLLVEQLKKKLCLIKN